MPHFHRNYPYLLVSIFLTAEDGLGRILPGANNPRQAALLSRPPEPQRYALLQPQVVDLTQGGNAASVRGRIEAHRIRILNVAGPRESKCPGIHDRAMGFLSIHVKNWY